MLETGPRVTSSPALPREGQRFGDYELVRLLGEGGMGTVYEADHLPSERRVALKVLTHRLDSSEARQRFLREGQLAASINHPNSVYIFGTEEIDGIPVISMELAPGGTLKDRVKEKGPIPVTEAVDVILQVIAGLEAAQAKGVLHRDVKPSNCFVDSDGTVKVGDFGLSISTLARPATHLTISGAFLGTPAFSSPEQVRGDELDVRSDIYAVGMTLYFLLTGKTPFPGENMIQLLAAVLERPAESPRKLRPEIPKGLAQVVLRCLAKKRQERFGDYTNLRNALLPFRPSALTSATRGTRFLAGAIDLYVIWTIVRVLQMPLMPLEAALNRFLNPIESFHDLVVWFFNYIDLTSLVSAWIYFALTEGLWGASVGKLLCRLRVVGRDQKTLGVWKSFLRALVFVAALYGPVFIFEVEAAQFWVDFESEELRFLVQQREPINSWIVACFTGLLYLLSFLLIFVGARQANGFAGWHELLSKTRVVNFQKTGWQLAAQPQPQGQPTVEPSTTPPGVSTIGPYRLLGSLHKTECDELFLGFDDRLLRKIWIRKFSKAEPLSPMARSSVSHSGRLRSVNGRRAQNECWDAYEALSGAPLLSMVAKPQAWSSVRYWLFDLAVELNAAAKDGTMLSHLGLERVWITAAGRAKLLDFPAPGLAQTIDEPKVNDAGVAPSTSAVSGQAETFIFHVATAALKGSALDAQTARERVGVTPLPLHATHFLSGLNKRAFLTYDDLVARLQALLDRIPAISRRLRFITIAWCGVPIIVSLAIGLVFLSQRLESIRESARDLDLVRLSFCLGKLETLRREARRGADNQQEMIKSLEVYIVSQFPELYDSRGPQPSKYNRESGLLHWLELVTTWQIFERHRSPTEREVGDATAIWEPILRQIEAQQVLKDAISARLSWWFFGPAFRLSCFMLIASLIAILLFRTPVVFHFKAIAVVTADGSKASRWRLCLRSVVGWLPVLLIPFLAIQASQPLFQPYENWFSMLYFGFPILDPQMKNMCGWLVVLLVGLTVLSFAWSLATPERSPQDRLAGTWLVPR